MKHIRNKTEFTLLMFSMLLYVGTPYVMFGAKITPTTKKIAPTSSVKKLALTKDITYFYGGKTLMNAEDDHGNMSSYLRAHDRSAKLLLLQSQIKRFRFLF